MQVGGAAVVTVRDDMDLTWGDSSISLGSGTDASHIVVTEETTKSWQLDVLGKGERGVGDDTWITGSLVVPPAVIGKFRVLGERECIET